MFPEISIYDLVKSNLSQPIPICSRTGQVSHPYHLLSLRLMGDLDLKNFANQKPRINFHNPFLTAFQAKCIGLKVDPDLFPDDESVFPVFDDKPQSQKSLSQQQQQSQLSQNEAIEIGNEAAVDSDMDQNNEEEGKELPPSPPNLIE